MASSQKFIARNRAPRVQIEYDVELYGAERKVQLPFVIGSPADEKSNPKLIRAQKDGKAPLEYLIWDVLEEEAFVLAHGGEKYGPRNWRRDKILASTYEGAIMRHFLAWAKGEDIDPDSGRSHMAHIRANAGLIMDATRCGQMIDDRGRTESYDQDGS